MPNRERTETGSMSINDESAPLIPRVVPISYREAIKEILKLGLPMTAGQLALILRLFFESAMLARMGDDAAAANGLIEPISGTFVLSARALLTAVAMLVGKEFAAAAKLISAAETNGESTTQIIEARNKKISAILRQAYLQAIGIGLPIAAIFISLEPILKAFGQSDAVAKLVGEYFQGYAGSIFFLMGLMGNRNVFNASGEQHLSLISSVLSSLTSIGFAYTLGFGAIGFPKWGVFGVGFSNTIATGLFFAISTLYIHFNPKFKAYTPFARPIFDWSLMKTMFTTGMPMVAIALTDLALSIFIAFLIGAFNDRLLIPQGFATQFGLLALVPFLTMMDTANIMIKRSLGGGKAQNVTRLGNIAIMIGQVMALFFAALYIAIPEQLLKILYPGELSPDLLQIFVNVMRINAIGSLFDALRIVGNGGNFGCGDMRGPTFISLFSMIVLGIPLALLMAYLVNPSPELINLSRNIAILIGAGFALTRWSVVSQIVSTEAPTLEPTSLPRHQGFLWNARQHVSRIFGEHPPHLQPPPEQTLTAPT
jgi:MATE family multidrug resistance protein